MHCIGVGSNETEFGVLQQMAQLGHGSMYLSIFEVSALRTTFTSISSNLTSSREPIEPSVLSFVGPTKRSVIFGPPPSKSNPFIQEGATTDIIQLKCIRRDFRWDPSRNDAKKTTETLVDVKRKQSPFTKGGMRFVYEMVELGGKHNMVAKETMNKTTTADDELTFVKCSCLARYYASLFATQTGLSICVLPCHLYSIIQVQVGNMPPIAHFCGETFMPGVFTKWLSNNGYVSCQITTEDAACFAHFTLQHSKGVYLVADIQGVVQNRGKLDQAFYFTDPQVLSLDKSFGRGDLGPEGILKFSSTHRCGKLCNKLGLRPLDPLRLSAGPKPQRPPPEANTVSRTSEATGAERSCKVFSNTFVHTYSRCPNKFHEVLDTGLELKLVRDALVQSGYSWRHDSGAKIFVDPQSYASVRDALVYRNLKPHHVVVQEKYESLLKVAIDGLPSKLRVDFVQKDQVALIHHDGEILCAKRTFLDVPRRLRNPASVTKSTGEAHGRTNHRRVQLSHSDNNNDLLEASMAHGQVRNRQVQLDRFDFDVPSRPATATSLQPRPLVVVRQQDSFGCHIQ